jgi:hypothetical protein
MAPLGAEKEGAPSFFIARRMDQYKQAVFAGPGETTRRPGPAHKRIGAARGFTIFDIAVF